jgi:hypothetical protein
VAERAEHGSTAFGPQIEREEMPAHVVRAA